MIVLSPSLDLQGYMDLVERGGSLGARCDRCSSRRLHGHGKYIRKAFISAERGELRLPIRRVLRLDCDHAPSVVPAFAAGPFRPDDAVVTSAAARYLDEPRATYGAVAGQSGITASTLHRWVGRLGGAGIASLLALLVRLRPEVDPLALLPKLVPDIERKARSGLRRGVLEQALRGLVAARHLAEALLGPWAGARPPILRLILGRSHMR